MLWFESRRKALFLFPLSLLYQLVVAFRNFFYDKGMFAIYRPPCKVISVGNITVGGTGKTPTVQFLANELLRRGKKVVILSRGYARKSRGTVIVSDGNHILTDAETAGDEPLLLARNCPGVPLIVDEDRVRAAQSAVRRFAADVILLDDGFQHRRLARDFDLITMRSINPLGNGWCLPAGPLREPVRSIRRADFVLFTGGSSLEKVPRQMLSAKPWACASYCFREAVDMQGKVLTLGDLKNCRVVAVCGLANPKYFFRMLEEIGIVIAVKIIFPDHYYYQDQDIEKINKTHRIVNADYVVTTEKDWVKLESRHVESNWLMMRMTLQGKNLSILLSRIENLLG
ncbi:MAG: tetraacyldisaccharide 4'-kinase [candidate division KSB1 bacterium]|nr:tetraacyldisaccharide 4'-kinase [candidate division KSB1 bacterium]